MITEEKAVGGYKPNNRPTMKKQTVEDTRRIDALQLKRRGILDRESGQIWTLSLKPGDELLVILHYRLVEASDLPSALELCYALPLTEDVEVEFREVVRLDSTPCHFGGRRWWFICPYVAKGRQCAHRVSAMRSPREKALHAARKLLLWLPGVSPAHL